MIKMKMRYFLGITSLSLLSILLLSCQDSEDGLGYENAKKYGGITITYSGKRPDGEDFSASKEFKFVTSPGDSRSGTDDYGTYFLLSRYNETLTQDDAVLISGWFLPDPSFYGFSISSWIESDGYAFRISENLAGYTDSFSDITYDDKTGRLKFSFDIILDADQSSTGQELTIHGEADLITLKQIQ